MRVAWFWLVLAACSSEGSLEIRVMPPTSPLTGPIEKVELYVGIHDENQDTIRPAVGERADTVWWKRDRDAAFDVQDMTADGVLYAFQAGSTDGVAAVVAVGLGGDVQSGDLVPIAVATQLVPMQVPSDEIHRYTLELGPFDALPRGDFGTPSDRPGLQLWGPPEDPRQCVEVDNVPELADYGVPTAMIVSHDDVDCDAAQVECDDHAYLSGTTMKRDDLSCTVPVDNAGCVLGGPACVDGIGDTDCAPSNYCVPAGVCESQCSDLNCTVASELGNVPHISCDLPYVQPETLLELCQDQPAELDLAILAQETLGLECDASLHAKLRTLDQSYSDQITYPSGLQVRLIPFDEAACQWKIFAQGALPSLVTDYVAAFAVPFTNPADRGLALPIVFHLVLAEGGCDLARPTCTLEAPSADDSLKACLHTPVRPEQIVAD
jgi:hypothetical protein